MGAPETGLVAALSTSAYAALLKAVAGTSYDQDLGSVASARIVQAAGLSIVESNRLAADEAILFHKDAIALMLRLRLRLRPRCHERQRHGRGWRADPCSAGIRPPTVSTSRWSTPTAAPRR